MGFLFSLDDFFLSWLNISGIEAEVSLVVTDSEEISHWGVICIERELHISERVALIEVDLGASMGEVEDINEGYSWHRVVSVDCSQVGAGDD